MKKILFSLAALAALASCVKDNEFEPQNPTPAPEGSVTITAVASPLTKTLIDGKTVTWEANDQIKVVVNKENFADFRIAKITDGEAQFLGDIDASVELASGVNAYAVYPASAVTVEEGTGNLLIRHSLPETQTGVIASGMNLSSAVLEVEDLRAGSADAAFHNALTLLNVTVPAGVSSVALTSEHGLVGNANFTIKNTDVSERVDDPNNPGQVIDQITPAYGNLTTSGGSVRTVTLSNGGNELEVKTYALLVYPKDWANLALTMTGVDGTEFKSSVSTALQASTSYDINLSKIFQMNISDEEFLSPAGGEITIPIVTTEDCTYTAETGADWIAFAPQSKALHTDNLVFNVAENTGDPRNTTVTIYRNGKLLKTFKVSQSGFFKEIMVDENGDPIQWEESFSIYANASDAASGLNAKATYKNVFEIGPSDDFSKGTYKIVGMFKTDCYYMNGLQTGKGGEYYADYADGKLIVKKANAVQSYYFLGDVVLTYNAADKTFTADSPLQFNQNMYSSYNKAGYIGGYTVAVKAAADPGAPESPYAYLFGEYTEDFNDASYYGSPAQGTLTIAASDNPDYHLQMTFFGGTSAQVTVYANVSADGTSVTTVQPAGYTSMGSFYASTLSLSDLSYGGPIWGTLKFDYPTVNDYTAFKK